MDDLYLRHTDAFVSLDGSNLTSLRLKPGTRPGSTSACSSAKLVMNVTTALTSSYDKHRVLLRRPPDLRCRSAMPCSL